MLGEPPSDQFAQGPGEERIVVRRCWNGSGRVLTALAPMKLTAEDRKLRERLAGTRRILVITEDWCGAAIAPLPFVMKLVEEAPGIEMRIFLRDQNPDLMDQYLKDGRYRSIPVFVFFDEDMNELARSIERRPA